MNMDKQHMKEVIEKSQSLFNLLKMIIPASTPLDVKINATANLFCNAIIDLPAEKQLSILAQMMCALTAEKGQKFCGNEDNETD